MAKPRLDLVPRLPADVLHRVIEVHGLEDCADLVAAATPEQLHRVLDVDLWRRGMPGADEQFDADRFGLWLEVLQEAGAAIAVRQLAGMDRDLLVAGIAHHARVFERAALAAEPAGELTFDLLGYVVVARRAGSWNAIVETLTSLAAEDTPLFEAIMRGCVALSNAGFEIDGLDALLSHGEQALHDLAADREQRREREGFVTAAQARAFLASARLGDASDVAASTPTRALLRAYSRALAAPDPVSDLAAGPTDPGLDALLADGVTVRNGRALLAGATTGPIRMARLHAALLMVRERDEDAYALRLRELGFLANNLVAGCAVVGRPLTREEAAEAAAAACNLALDLASIPATWLVDHDLASLFQAGWKQLHERVCIFAAKRLIQVLNELRCDDSEIQAGLDALFVELRRHCRDGAPWRARHQLDVLATLDAPAWAALLALIDECPVMHAAIAASKDRRARTVDPSAFEFISEKRQIVAVHEFLAGLPETLTRV